MSLIMITADFGREGGYLFLSVDNMMYTMLTKLIRTEMSSKSSLNVMFIFITPSCLRKEKKVFNFLL